MMTSSNQEGQDVEDNIPQKPPYHRMGICLPLTLRYREWRHSPCLMRPLTLLLSISILLLFILISILKFPALLLGFLLNILTSRGNWLVEFLYPLSIAKWGHILLMKWGSAKKNGRLSVMVGSGVGKSNINKSSHKTPLVHSRCMEQRTEVVKGRVYVHPLPQLLDNIGYVIICLPPPSSTTTSTSSPTASSPITGTKKKSFFKKNNSNKNNEPPPTPIVALLVDVGDASSVQQQVDLISNYHYSNLQIRICGILSTHKHHDHTAGNITMSSKLKVVNGKCPDVYGGAVENVPGCNRFVRNGDCINLPKVGINDMNDVVYIECVAVPSHTRGSVVYTLRPNAHPYNMNNDRKDNDEAHLFTGDAMFSGGGGVAFEADLEFANDKKSSKERPDIMFRSGAGVYSIERCFAEILVRARGKGSSYDYNDDGDCNDLRLKREEQQHHLTNFDSYSNIAKLSKVLVYPGHEYTIDLLRRQLDRSYDYASKWCTFEPAVFFDLVSNYFISDHRRSLPRVNRLLTVPTTLNREMNINPHMRSLRKRGEHLIAAVKSWYHYGDRVGSISESNGGTNTLNSRLINQSIEETNSSNNNNKTPSTNHTWTMNGSTVNQPIFSTVYHSDLTTISQALSNGTISALTASRALCKLPSRLNDPVVDRRPIPNTLPNDRSMHLGCVSLAILGSAPCALTVRDGLGMRLPPPAINSDRLDVSLNRVLDMLEALGLIECEGGEIEDMLQLLWKEAGPEMMKKRTDEEDPTNTNDHNENDMEDLLELGLLKMVLYGIAPSGLANSGGFCGICCKSDGGINAAAVRRRKATKKRNKRNGNESKIKRTGGELVRHDVTTCLMCRDAVGCPIHDGAGLLQWLSNMELEEKQQQGNNDDRKKRVEGRLRRSRRRGRGENGQTFNQSDGGRRVVGGKKINLSESEDSVEMQFMNSM